MIDGIKELYKKYELYLFPFLLTLALTTSIFDAYAAPFFSEWTLYQVLIIAGSYILFAFMRRHRFIGAVLYVVIGMFCLTQFFRLVFEGDYGSGFSQWFLSGASEVPTERRYYYALLVSFPIFLSSVVYYFSVMLYRTSFLMLSCLIPCAIYVKILSDMSNMYLVVIAGMNAAIFMVNTGRNAKNADDRGQHARFAAIVAVTLVTLVLASLIPKQGDAIYYDRFESVFMNAGIGGGSSFNMLGEHSGNAQDFRNLSNTPLYDVYADELIYFRRQNFDLYRASEHCWYPLEKYSAASKGNYGLLYDRQALMSYDDMLDAIKKASQLDPSFADRYGIRPELLALENTGEEQGTAMIIPSSHPANYGLVSVRAYSSSLGNDGLAEVTLHRELVAADKFFSGTRSYGMEYYREFTSRNGWMVNGGADFTEDNYDDFLDDMYALLEKDNDTALCSCVNAFREDYAAAMEYKSDTAGNNSEIPADIAELALQLTEGMTYDWQKAAAIQEYFQSGSFAYDLDYVPPERYNTASYFVFTSQRGTCSDFATAYTLMARAAGLIVRYTEGFSPDYTSERGLFRIRANCSHAYPEVYIRNMGWLVYEPTVSSMYSVNFGDEGNNNNGGIEIDYSTLFNVIIAVAVAAGIAVLIFFIIPFIGNIADEIKIRKGDTAAYVLMYRKVRRKLSRSEGKTVFAMTPSELGQTAEKYGADIGSFLNSYGEVVFGGALPDNERFERSHAEYTAFMKTRLRKPALRQQNA